MSVIPVLKRWRREDQELEPYLSYIAVPCLKTKIII
jgi:hypothetical protein